MQHFYLVLQHIYLSKWRENKYTNISSQLSQVELNLNQLVSNYTTIVVILNASSPAYLTYAYNHNIHTYIVCIKMEVITLPFILFIQCISGISINRDAYKHNNLSDIMNTTYTVMLAVMHRAPSVTL